MRTIASPINNLAEQQVDLLPIGICVIDHKFKIHTWNRMLFQWTGISTKSAIGSNLLERYLHLTSARFLKRMESVFEVGQPALFAPSAIHPFIPVTIGG